MLPFIQSGGTLIKDVLLAISDENSKKKGNVATISNVSCNILNFLFSDLDILYACYVYSMYLPCSGSL